MNKKVLILILNWNKIYDLVFLLKQIQYLDYKNFDCLVVDNASTDDSVSELKKNFPDILLIENDTNLGGTGGYNTGLEYALNQNIYEYIWLLDNDTNIESNTLTELVNVMDKYNDIGIAGSRIVDINNKNTTVELGAYLERSKIGVNPYKRNKLTYNEKDEIVEVDYVAICSALIRSSALKKVGTMDQRFFIFWDDVDWGLKFKKYGYKVVGVGNSVVYHPSFTERRRGQLTDFYYGIRNPLLVYSKHFNLFKRSLIFYIYFRKLLKIIIFKHLTKANHGEKLAIRALKDFIDNKWGKCVLPSPEIEKPNLVHAVKIENLKAKKILIISDDIADNIIKLKSIIEESIPDVELTLLVIDDRKEIYEENFKKLIVIENKKNNKLIYNLKIFMDIVFNNYDYVISTFSNPFTFAALHSLRYYPEENAILRSNNNIKRAYIPIISTIFGEILSFLYTPFILYKSLKY
ncbi:MAG: glycosyltransferase [Candidatus Dadabacteria bacterium]|nr:glycosyltransferase [Candidatus Dadabacteria bacterium]